MSSATVKLSRLLSVCCHAVEAAGDAIRRICGSQVLNTAYKGVKDPVTDADYRSQELIVGTLKSVWPHLCVIGEEDIPESACVSASLPSVTVADSDPVAASTRIPGELEHIPTDQLIVWVDPLDGTVEFVEKNYHAVTVLVGISWRGSPIAGVVHQPFFDADRGRTLWGVVGGDGVHGLRSGPPLSSMHSAAPAADVGPVVTTTRTHGTPAIERSLELLRPSRVIRVGGAGYKVVMLLEGQADVYVMASPATSKWDTCAPEALLRAAGGALTDIRGEMYRYTADAPRKNAAGVLACRAADLGRYVSALSALSKI